MLGSVNFLRRLRRPPPAAFPEPRDWEADPAWAAAATDAALGTSGNPARRADLAGRALAPPFGRGCLRMALHLQASGDIAARQAARLALGAYALVCKDVDRADALFSAYLDESCGQTPDGIGRALDGAILARTRRGETEGALALEARRDVSGRDHAVARARLLLEADPGAALAALDRCGAGRGEDGPVASGLRLALLLDRGEVDAAERLARSIADRPDQAALSRACLLGIAIARSGDRELQADAFDAFGVTLSRSGGFDDLRIAARDPAPKSGGPLVSVVMTAFEAESHISTAIRAILAQTWRDLELIVVDDCSGDGTFARLEALAWGDPRIRVLRTDYNGGTYLAKNLGIKSARGDFVALCDADDAWTPDHLAAHMTAMDARPDVVLSISNWLRVSQDGAIEIRPPANIIELCPHSTLFRRGVFDQVGLFDSVRIGADREIVQRVALEYGPRAVLRMGRVLTLGRRHGASLTMSGAGAIASTRTPEIRRTYRTTWVGWHLDRIAAGRPLWNSGRPEDRPYPVPDAMV